MKFSIVKVIIKGFFNLLEVVEEDVVDLLNGLLEVVVFDVVVFLGLEKKDLKFWFLNLLKLILLNEGVFIWSLLILLNLRLFLLKLLNLRFFLLMLKFLILRFFLLNFFFDKGLMLYESFLL